ncbi:hypothetical protein E2C01_086941 [Portunus trituberculatus]|uniref:Uncharacterized protein n=1 Tax=Portunus trituberculatus TaxID=210409 RepID=A0A5B7JAN7_PORTR|nr:hypothetical protein [Portunus trituberculatus]
MLKHSPSLPLSVLHSAHMLMKAVCSVPLDLQKPATKRKESTKVLGLQQSVCTTPFLKLKHLHVFNTVLSRDKKRCFPRRHATGAVHPVRETQTLNALTNTQRTWATQPLIPPYTYKYHHSQTHKLHSPTPN